jgi:hypothetical protein
VSLGRSSAGADDVHLSSNRPLAQLNTDVLNGFAIRDIQIEPYRTLEPRILMHLSRPSTVQWTYDITTDMEFIKVPTVTVSIPREHKFFPVTDISPTVLQNYATGNSKRHVVKANTLYSKEYYPHLIPK